MSMTYDDLFHKDLRARYNRSRTRSKSSERDLSTRGVASSAQRCTIGRVLPMESWEGMGGLCTSSAHIIDSLSFYLLGEGPICSYSDMAHN